MTEIDAEQTSLSDAQRVLDFITAGALPVEISNRFLAVIVSRIIGFGGDSSKAREAIRGAGPCSTFAEHLLFRGMAAIRSALPTLAPEDRRALLTWFCGREPGGGIARKVTDGIGESSGMEALRIVDDQCRAYIERVNAADVEFFGKIDSLNPVRARLVRGMLLEATWYAQENDGVSAKRKMICARKLLHRFLKGVRVSSGQE